MMLAVKGIYDGKVVRLLKPVEVERPYQVEVIFLERIGKDLSAAGEGNLERFIGMWADFTPEEENVFQAVLEERSAYFAGRQFDFDEEDSQ